jgi:pseudouridine synthase
MAEIEKTLPERLGLDQPFRLYPIGRLDRKTSGLLLCTNDGDLSTMCCRPGLVEKEYHVSTNVRPTQEQLDRLMEGITLNDGPARAVRAEVLSISESEFIVPAKKRRKGAPRGKAVEEAAAAAAPQTFKKYSASISVTVRHGRNRIVRRMCAAVGIPVMQLRRVRIGPLHLDDFGLNEPSAHALLTPEQVEQLWGSGGGRERFMAHKLHSIRKLVAACTSRADAELTRDLVALRDWLQEYDQQAGTEEGRDLTSSADLYGDGDDGSGVEDESDVDDDEYVD